MATISLTLQRIKQDIQPFLPDHLVHAACQQIGYRWRERLLDPVTTIHLFILQILSFNTAMTHLRHLAKMPVQAGSYCKARMRLPLAVLQRLVSVSAHAMLPAGRSSGRWLGLKVWLVDGSSSILPDTPLLQNWYPQPKGQKPGCGFPVMKVLGVLDAFSGMMLEVMAFPLYTHEASKVWLLHWLLGRGDLLVGDRGFCSYVHLALLVGRKVQGLFRMHQRRIVDFRPHRKSHRKGQTAKPSSRFVKRLGKYDQIVQWLKPKTPPKWMSRRQFDRLVPSLQVREIRYWLAAKGQRTRCVTIVTTLLDPLRYPKDKVIELYGLRWRAETHFAELKTTLKMRQLKSRTVLGVQKELAIYALVYNLVHAVMLQAARRQQVPPDRLSFIDTVRWLLSAQPGEPIPDLLVNPTRADRHEPRVVKDRHDSYLVMTRPRKELRNALRKQGKEA